MEPLVDTKGTAAWRQRLLLSVTLVLCCVVLCHFVLCCIVCVFCQLGDLSLSVFRISVASSLTHCLQNRRYFWFLTNKRLKNEAM